MSVSENNSDSSGGLVGDAPESWEDLAQIEVPVGISSADGSALVGKGGFVFLTHGTNLVLEQYSRPVEPAKVAAITDRVDRLENVFVARNDYCTARGIDFRQVVVPDKMSALAHLVPIDIATPMTVTSLLEERLRKAGWFLSAGDVLSGPDREKLWVKYDTHISGLGGHALASRVLSSLSFLPVELSQLQWSVEKFYAGDLGDRLFGFPLWDRHFQPAPAKVLNWWELKFVRTPPPSGKHVGQKIAFRNPNPNYDKSLLVFGDSFTSGGVRPSQLSYWFKCLSRDYTFVWSSQFDEAVVEELRPDVVVCQTAERFLTRVPES